MFSFKKFGELEYVFDSTNFNFHVMAIPETKITKNKVLIKGSRILELKNRVMDYDVIKTSYVKL